MSIFSIKDNSVVGNSHEDILKAVNTSAFPKKIQFGFIHSLPNDLLPLPRHFTTPYCDQPETCEGIGGCGVIIFDWDALIYPGCSPDSLNVLPGVLETLLELRLDDVRECFLEVTYVS
jgi:hypothetical protein